MTEQSFRKQIYDMCRAGFSGVIINTNEIARAEAELIRAARDAKRGFQRWTCVRGWMKASDDNEGRVTFVDKSGGTDGEPSNGVEAVMEIRDMPNGQILCMHVFPELFRDPNTREAFKDILDPAREQKKLVVLIGSFEIPGDLMTEFAPVDFDLPDRKELELIARDLVSSTSVDMPSDPELAKVVDAALGLTELEAQNAYALSLVRTKTLDISSIVETKKSIVKRSGILTYVESNESLDTVGGLDVLKGWLRGRAAGFTQKALDFGLTPPKGILLAGVPGCGKSLVAKSVSAAWGLPLLNLDMGRVFGSLVGQSEQQLRMALKTAEALAPCILFIDEFEKATSGLGAGSSDGGTTQRVMGSFLTWLQDKPKDKPVFVIATANNITSLPPEMIRKGRWDEVWCVTLPTAEERKEIFRIHLTKINRHETVDWDYDLLASISDGFTGSEIEEAVKDALWSAFAAEREITMADLNTACRSVIALSEGPMKPLVDMIMKDNRFKKASSSDVAGGQKGRQIEA